jgi:hypothetical protein
MAYSDFTLNQVKEAFGLTTDADQDLFASVEEVAISDFLRMQLERRAPLGVALGTEKARSEFIIAPLLAEARDLLEQRVSLFSGRKFNVAPKQGLKGICDFIFARSPEQFDLTAPVLMVVEAKQEDLVSAFGQCVAEMVAARLFNEKEDIAITTIYGAVTSGSEWKFLKLEGSCIFIDKRQYYLAQAAKILSILATILREEDQAQALAA